MIASRAYKIRIKDILSHLHKNELHLLLQDKEGFKNLEKKKNRIGPSQDKANRLYYK